MGLKKKKSLYDSPTLGNLGNKVEDAVPDPNFNTLNGTSDSPFQSKNGSGDHLKDLLQDKIVRSTNSSQVYDPQQMKGISPGPPVPGGDQDLDGTTGGQGYFHGIPNPGKGQGKQLGGKDLHEHLLTKTYNYNHGNAVPENVGPSPGATGNSEYQDLDGVDGGEGYFHGIPNPGMGQGKQLNGKDLHKSILTDPYNYSHQTPNVTVGPSPGPSGNSPFQDLNGGLPANGEYLNNLPQ